MDDLLEKVLQDARYLKNIQFVPPRSGHPEGEIKHHIADLEANLRRLAARDITDEQRGKLLFLIHVHDTFKAEASLERPHELLAREYAAEFTDDPDLLNILEYHDLNYDLWRQFTAAGAFDEDLLARVLNLIIDIDLFLMFIIIDGSTKGKNPHKLGWFISEVRQRRQTVVDESWLIFSAEDYLEDPTP